MRHLLSLAILSWLLAWTIKNPDGTYFADYEQAWPLEATFYFVTLNRTDADGNPEYSAWTPTRTYIWPRVSCGPMGANACVQFDNGPEPGSVWMVEDTPKWCCRKLDGAP